jgi:hypothetical protein
MPAAWALEKLVRSGLHLVRLDIVPTVGAPGIEVDDQPRQVMVAVHLRLDAPGVDPSSGISSHNTLRVDRQSQHGDLTLMVTVIEKSARKEAGTDASPAKNHVTCPSVPALRSADIAGDIQPGIHKVPRGGRCQLRSAQYI